MSMILWCMSNCNISLHKMCKSGSVQMRHVIGTCVQSEHLLEQHVQVPHVQVPHASYGSVQMRHVAGPCV